MNNDAGEFLGPEEHSALMEAAALIRRIIRDATRYIIRALPFLIRALAVGGGLMGAVIAVYQVWETFGGDAAAFVLAFAIGCIPFVYCMTRGLISFGGILASGSVSAGVGLVFWVIPLLYSNILIVLVLGILLVLQMSRRADSEETTDEQN